MAKAEVLRSPIAAAWGVDVLRLWAHEEYQPRPGDVLVAAVWRPVSTAMVGPPGWTVAMDVDGVPWPDEPGAPDGVAKAGLWWRRVVDDVLPVGARFHVADLGGRMVMGRLVAYRPGEFVCQRCLWASHHPKDAEFGWCEHCKAETGPGLGPHELGRELLGRSSEGVRDAATA